MNDDKIENIDKEIINVDTYNYKEYTITAYTALWCNPCKNIKPHLLEYVKNYVHISSEKITKDHFKNVLKHQYVPFFIISNNTKCSDKQTSDKDKLKEFFDEFINGISFTDDF